MPKFVDSLAALAQDRRRVASERLKVEREIFSECIWTTLHLIEAQSAPKSRAEAEVAELRNELEVFIRPLRKEFASRQGAFGHFLRKTIPQRIEDRVAVAKEQAKQEIRQYLKGLKPCHWRTLQASVRKKGEHYGVSSSVDLRKHFAMPFEEFIAEAWGKAILNDVRSETRAYARDLETIIEEVVRWAVKHVPPVETALVKAQRNSLRADTKKLEHIGREMAKEMRDLANVRLVRAIEGPIKNACEDFVRQNFNCGAGVKGRILGMFDGLAEKVADSAEYPANKILQDLFKEVQKEIKEALADHQNPLDSIADSIAAPARDYLGKSDAQLKKLRVALVAVMSKQPASKALAARA